MGDLISLNTRRILELRPTTPFHFDATMHKPDHFPSSDNAWSPGVRWQTMRWRGTPLGLKFEELGSVDRPLISLSVWSEHELRPSLLESLIEEIAYRCNLRLELAEFYARFVDDPLLGPVLEAWRGMRPATHASLYEYLIVAIVLQNATVRRSVNMMQALFEAHGTTLAYDGQELSCFWVPESLNDLTGQDLRLLKVGYRAKSIVRVGEAFARKEIDEFTLREAPKEERRQALLDLYGIGPASVWYILFDVFHQCDELNHISPWEQKIYSKLLFDRDPDDPVPVDRLLKALDDRFGEWKMLAVHYLWEDLFWKRTHEQIPWLERLIRL
jgi:3-methyladenine DNA glycosylase/8-oxoguanine DNA glycosylase